MPEVVQAEWVSTVQEAEQKAELDAQQLAGAEKARQDLLNKIEAENNGEVQADDSPSAV